MISVEEMAESLRQEAADRLYPIIYNKDGVIWRKDDEAAYVDASGKLWSIKLIAPSGAAEEGVLVQLRDGQRVVMDWKVLRRIASVAKVTLYCHKCHALLSSSGGCAVCLTKDVTAGEPKPTAGDMKIERQGREAAEVAAREVRIHPPQEFYRGPTHSISYGDTVIIREGFLYAGGEGVAVGVDNTTVGRRIAVRFKSKPSRVELIPVERLLVKEAPKKDDPVNPKHYNDLSPKPIEVIEAWRLGFCLGNTVKYIARHGRKDSRPEKAIEDLEKARWYLDRRIQQLKEGKHDAD